MLNFETQVANASQLDWISGTAQVNAHVTRRTAGAVASARHLGGGLSLFCDQCRWSSRIAASTGGSSFASPSRERPYSASPVVCNGSATASSTCSEGARRPRSIY